MQTKIKKKQLTLIKLYAITRMDRHLRSCLTIQSQERKTRQHQEDFQQLLKSLRSDYTPKRKKGLLSY